MPNYSSWHSSAVFWYLVLGFIHELVHWIVAVACLSHCEEDAAIPCIHDARTGSLDFWYNLIIARRFLLIRPGTSTSSDKIPDINGTIEIIRHAGWVASLLIAFVVEQRFQKKGIQKNTRTPPLRWAVWVTTLEAVWTDLLQLPTLPALLFTSDETSAAADAYFFCCGNFGMILLHHAWWTYDNECTTALSVLEKLVQVTMMRGAQSGGVVCFHPKKNYHKNCKHETRASMAGDVRFPALQGIRSRIVNHKRTDLSVLLRSKVSHDNHMLRLHRPTQPLLFPKDFVPVFSGHTRFATSSKASLQDTHPLRWTPASPRRVYNLNQMKLQEQQQVHVTCTWEPQSVLMENFITHNGDFDFYRINGHAYENGQILKWLERVLNHRQPAAVDSSGVAGMVDLLRTQGCFGLSARHTVCLGLPISTIEGDSEPIPFPPYSHFEKIGSVFEHVFQEMLKTTSISSIDDSPSIRDSFAMRVQSKLEARREELFGVSSGLSRYADDSEGGVSLLAFCIATIRAFFDNDLLATTQTFLAHAVGSFGLCVTSSLDAHRQLCLAARGQTMSLAFYPRKGIILYGSEQAAVKAGMRTIFPGDPDQDLDHSLGDVDNDALRLDFDGGSCDLNCRLL